MSDWRSTKAMLVYAALLRIGWSLERQVGSLRRLQRPGLGCLHVAIGPVALARMAKDTGLRPDDL